MGEKVKSIHAGHRERLRSRLRSEGLASFSEHEVLELLLTYAIPRQDVNPLAHELIARFGRLSHVLDADESELMQVRGMGANAALLLTMMPQLMRYYQLNMLGDRPVIRNFAQAMAYCEPLFLGAHEEHLYMVCLSQKGDVLHLSLLHTGTVSEVALYPRKVVEVALRHNAHSVILAHNHPGGMSEPSQADITTTKAVAAALQLIGIGLVDHLIFAPGHVYSMTRERKNLQVQQEDLGYVCAKHSAVCDGLKEDKAEWIMLTAEDL